VRASGVAFECDEAVLGESSAAATVFDATGLAVGGVAVVVPTNEWPLDDAVIDAVRSTARTMSRELGANQWPTTPPGFLRTSPLAASPQFPLCTRHPRTVM
jgi:Bacterial transcriptional regulator